MNLRTTLQKTIFLFMLGILLYFRPFLSKKIIEIEVMTINILDTCKKYCSEFSLYLENRKQLTQTINKLNIKLHDLEKINYKQYQKLQEYKKIYQSYNLEPGNVKLTTDVLRKTFFKGHYSYLIRLNNKQVEPNDLAIYNNCLLGKVTESNINGAYILSIFDKNFHIPVLFKKSNVEAIVSGQGVECNKMSIIHIKDRHSKIMIDDEVVTSDSDGETLPNIIVGQVKQNKKGEFYVKNKAPKNPEYITILKSINSFF